MSARTSFVRDFAIAALSLFVPGLVSVIGGWWTGHGAKTPMDLLLALGDLTGAVLWVGAVLSITFRCIGEQPAWWKEIVAGALAGIPLQFLWDNPHSIGFKLLAALVLGVYAASARKKILAWLARRHTSRLPQGTMR